MPPKHRLNILTLLFHVSSPLSRFYMSLIERVVKSVLSFSEFHLEICKKSYKAVAPNTLRYLLNLIQ